MTMTMDLDTERIPVGRVLAAATSEAVKPFGISVARWQPNFRHDRDAVTLDPDTQIGYVGDRALKELVTAATSCSIESDGKDVLTVDWVTDDK
jgi:hypothetical protein